jgi:uncharacterized membrane protein YbhN (UPF0104 family)
VSVARTLARVGVASALGLALLAWVTRGVDWTRLDLLLRPVAWWGWGAAALGLVASYVLRALRIQAELGRRIPRPLTLPSPPVGERGEKRRRADAAIHGPGLRACLEVMLVHNAAVNVLPMRGGEAAYPWLLHRRLGVPVGEAVASLVWMRVQDAIVLAALAAALWPGLAPAVRLGGAAALAAAAVGGLRLLDRAATSSPLPQRGRGQGEGAVPRIRARIQGALHALALAPRHGWRGWAYCGGNWVVKILALGGLLSALAGLAPREGVTGALGGELAGVLPLQGPAGLGTYEVGVWAGAALRGRTAAEIAAAALAVHALSFATAVIAGAVAHVVARRRPLPSSSPALEHDHG